VNLGTTGWVEGELTVLTSEASKIREIRTLGLGFHELNNQLNQVLM